MAQLDLNKSIILDNKYDKKTIGYDVRIYNEYQNFSAACLFNKAKILCKNGEFGISDKDFSNQLGISLRNFKRAKRILRDRLSMRIGAGNKTFYSLVNDMPYEPTTYRSFDLNNLFIMNNNLKAAAFLGQCLFWWNKALENGELEFSKTDKQIIKDMPFLSIDILNSIKKIAVIKGFLGIKRKKRGSEWGVSHYTIYPLRIEKAIKQINESQLSMTNELESKFIVYAKIPIECVPKSRLSVCQNPVSTIIYTINNSILSSANTQKQPYTSLCEVVSEERKKIINNVGKQPISASNHITNFNQEEKMEEKKELYQMIGIWKEIVSKDEEIVLSSKLLTALEEAFIKKCGSSIDNWKMFCNKVNENDWLMGKNPSGWKARILWAIKPEKMDEILNNAIYSKNKKADYRTDQTPISIDKQEMIDEVINSNCKLEIKKIKLSLIDSLEKVPHNIGMTSYHSYFRHADFDISESGEKKKLTIKSSYNAYIGTLSFHEIISTACAGFDFDDVILFGGTNDRLGNHIYMQRTTPISQQCELWEKLNLDIAIKSLMNISNIDEINNFPAKSVG